MYFGLAKIQLSIIALANGVADVENAGFGLESQPETSAEISMRKACRTTFEVSRATIAEHKKIRVLPDEIAVFQCGNCIFISINTFFVKATQ